MKDFTSPKRQRGRKDNYSLALRAGDDQTIASNRRHRQVEVHVDAQDDRDQAGHGGQQPENASAFDGQGQGGNRYADLGHQHGEEEHLAAEQMTIRAGAAEQHPHFIEVGGILVATGIVLVTAGGVGGGGGPSRGAPGGAGG